MAVVLRSRHGAVAVSIAAEAWVVELPRDAEERPALPSAADRVWRTTLTAERGVTAVLLPMAALPSLLALHPQVTYMSADTTNPVFDPKIWHCTEPALRLGRQAEVDFWAALAARQACLDRLAAMRW